MAITKIMCMKSAEHGNVAAHLKHSLAYICNETKTEKGSLVGGINCLPDFAYEQERTYKYVEPPVYHPGYALHKKPSNAFQQRYYGKLYRMCVVQKCRFQYKYTRYQQDLIRMKELQEEYLFLNREGINGWEDVFRAKQTAEQRSADIDAKKKELYKEHARYKYQYEKEGDVTVYLYHEAHYREQLAELKERRKEAKRECATINRCISESTFAHMEIPLDVDVENLYMVDVPEFEGSEISYGENKFYNEVEVYKMEKPYVDVEGYETERIDVADVLFEVEVAEREPAAAEVLQEEGNVISEQELDYGVNESETFTKLYEPINESIEVVDEVYADLQNFATPDMTKERYEALTDKEKVEWLGIADCSVQDAIQKFISSLTPSVLFIGIVMICWMNL